MRTKLNRRLFIQKSLWTAGSLAALPVGGRLHASESDLGARVKPDRKLRCALIGCGNRGQAHLDAAIGEHQQDLVAGIDPDQSRHAFVSGWLRKNRPDAPVPRFFTDYREFFDKHAREVDAIFIATPNHQHALPALLAIQHGIPVYCEKPLCHDIGEARQLRKMALAHPKVATQMGNQGHCDEGYRRLVEYLRAGIIGEVRETHSWTNRANGGLGERPPAIAVPKELAWDTWIGPAPYRDYHEGLHPHGWHDWYDFGNGSIGNMGCHVLDGVYWALGLEHPSSVEMEQCRGGSHEQFPVGARIRWDFPARGKKPPVHVYWYEGFRPDASLNQIGDLQQVSLEAQNLPEVFKKLKEQFPDEEFASSGTLYLGEKGTIYTGTYGEHMHIVPIESMKDFPKVRKTLPRLNNVFANFVDTVLQGKSDTGASFDYAARLTEFSLLANLAMRAGTGNKVQWDGPAMNVTNMKELNQWVAREPREGWRI